MRRIVLILVLIWTVVGTAPFATAQTSSSGVCYVIVEKEGLDLYVGLYATQEQARERLVLVRTENARRKRTNDAIESDVKELEKQIAAKKREIAEAEKEKDAATKATLEREIEAIEASIVEKNKGRVRIVKVNGPKTFRSRKSAEAYMEKLYTEADKAREKVEDKKREEEKKRREAGED